MYRKSLLGDGECAMVAAIDDNDDDDDDEASAVPRRDSLSILNDALLNAARHDGRVRNSNTIHFKFDIASARNYSEIS